MNEPCTSARLAIGGDPRNLPPEVERHLAGCAACRQFLDETRALDTRIEAALQLPLHRFRQRETAPPRRRLALAASVLVALLVGGGAWLFRPQPALAADVVEHVRHEEFSWSLERPLAPDEVAAVLERAGVRFDTRMPVVYASPCALRGHVAPHLVVQTDDGPVTVMLLPGIKVARREAFDEHGLVGVLLPAGEGSVAVLTRGANLPQTTEKELVSAVRW